MTEHRADERRTDDRWRVKMVQPRLPWITRPVLPADLGNELCSVVLNRENALEDAHYQKVVPNRFIVEVNPDNFARNYQPMEGRVIQQWLIRIGECLSTANSRLGRKEYVLAGKISIQTRPADDLQKHQARILYQIWQGQPQPGQRNSVAVSPKAPPAPRPQEPLQIHHPEVPAAPALTACLEEQQTGQRWKLFPGTLTLGRLETCDIFVNSPVVQERRLVSGLHAFLRSEGGRVRLYDGSPDGRPSLNGTYVNGRRIFATGYELKDGDTITLAAADPAHPSPDAPGVVSLRFLANC